MSLVQLYKIHINPTPNGAEIHYFYTKFNLGIEIYSPNHIELQLKDRKERYNKAKEYILSNSISNSPAY